jgi:hypothetical protein
MDSCTATLRALVAFWTTLWTGSADNGIACPAETELTTEATTPFATALKAARRTGTGSALKGALETAVLMVLEIESGLLVGAAPESPFGFLSEIVLGVVSPGSLGIAFRGGLRTPLESAFRAVFRDEFGISLAAKA